LSWSIKFLAGLIKVLAGRYKHEWQHPQRGYVPPLWAVYATSVISAILAASGHRPAASAAWRVGVVEMTATRMAAMMANFIWLNEVVFADYLLAPSPDHEWAARDSA